MRSSLGGLALVLAALTGCGVGSASKQETLRFAYNISSDDVEASKKRIRLLHDYLEKALKMKVEMVLGTSYSSTVEAMRAKRIDAATLGPMAYLLAAQKANAEAIAIPGTKSGGPGTYQSAIVVRGDSPVQTIDELLDHAEKYTFSFVDPSSTSGHLIPRAYLEGREFLPEKRFRKIHFANDHLTTAYTILGKKVDAGAMMPSIIRILENKGKIKPGDLRVLWESNRIPQSPLAVRKDLAPELKDRIRAAFVAIADVDPGLAKEMQVTTQHPDFCYYPANDAMYDDLRKIARSQTTMRLID
jgi:phosphonate transport system substrate-binding protein